MTKTFKTYHLLLVCFLAIAGFAQAQTNNADDSYAALKKEKDSALTAAMHADSLKIDKEYKQKMKFAKLASVAIFPALNAGMFSEVVPVKDPTEVPDPTMDYKLLFEVVSNNPDSTIGQINAALTEVARIINLHAASGIPLKKIFPVIVVHGGALNTLATNEYYQKHYKINNPNIKLINDFTALGTKIIACGQAMAFLGINSTDLLPVVKQSLTAQTVISSYQLKGYVKYEKLFNE